MHLALLGEAPHAPNRLRLVRGRLLEAARREAREAGHRAERMEQQDVACALKVDATRMRLGGEQQHPRLAAAAEAAARAAPAASRQNDAAGLGACLARGGAAAVDAAIVPEAGPCFEAFLLFAPRGDAATREVLRRALAESRVGDQSWSACARAAVARRDAPPGTAAVVASVESTSASGAPKNSSQSHSTQVVAEAVAAAFASGNADAAAACVAQITAPAPRGALLARFWRQRFRVALTPILSATPPSAARDRALVALARGAPPAVIVEEATTLGAAAARALGAGRDGNQAAAAAVLLTLARGGASTEAAASGAVKACAAAACDSNAPPAARADAVRCLGALAAELPHARFYPHRKAVGAALSSVLSDERRCLRALAARSGDRGFTQY